MLSSVDDVVDTELVANRVVSLPCIPSRRDPVGVWLGMGVTSTALDSETFTIELVETDARLGSHPSGCRNPEILFAQSVFMLDGDEPIFAHSQSATGEVTTLEFSVSGRAEADLDVVILPTFAFVKKDGTRETTIFGLVGRYSIS